MSITEPVTEDTVEVAEEPTGEAEVEVLVEEISIDGMCGVY
jgi:mycofactocin precursor